MLSVTQGDIIKVFSASVESVDKCTEQEAIIFSIANNETHFMHCALPGLYGMCVVLYGCDTWLLTLREKRRLRVFENRVLKIIFWPKRDKETEEWRKLHNEELNDHIPRHILFGNKIGKNEVGGACSTYWGEERCNRVLVGKPEEKSNLEEPGVNDLSQDRDR